MLAWCGDKALETRTGCMRTARVLFVCCSHMLHAELAKLQTKQKLLTVLGVLTCLHNKIAACKHARTVRTFAYS